ncbi:hypothetical protein CSC94_12445 [Zhengella mangrovi]|uniref:Uncharacterized protein n=1 Tax=Zhengella mangrovi TaxID=1982044 RepID=A0A2G1QN59_9HYPH|nr:hypothetical protein [Zhengella mangrovi]PHP66901.1 hypothetical protein CSC94_12445 [Zhengella mangrovi]
MRGVAFLFFATAALWVTVGMAWGIHMSASGDHMLRSAHAHLNLIGWVTMGLFGVYYHLVPDAAGRMLAKVHYAVALLGVLTIVPGIVMAVTQQGETLAKVGSMLTLLSMVIFLYTVISTRTRAA